MRAWAPSDAQWYIDQLSEADIQRFTTESMDTTVDQFGDTLAVLTADEDQFGRAIIDPDSGSLAGNLAASRDRNSASVAYWIAEGMRGRGLARRAVAECCSWIERRWPQVQQARLFIHPDNAASIRVAWASGFTRDPSLDRVIEVRGDQRPMHAYARQLRIVDA